MCDFYLQSKQDFWKRLRSELIKFVLHEKESREGDWKQLEETQEKTNNRSPSILSNT